MQTTSKGQRSKRWIHWTPIDFNFFRTFETFSNIDLGYRVQRGTKVTVQQREEDSFTTGPHWAQLQTSAHMDLTSLLTNSLNTYSISICDSLESNAAKFSRQADFDDLFVVSKGAAVQFAGHWSRIAGCSWRMLAYVCACERLRLRRVVAMHSKNYQAEP